MKKYCLLLALLRFFDRTLPAFPIINVTRMRHLVETADPTSALYPSRILCAILAHAIIYYPCVSLPSSSHYSR